MNLVYALLGKARKRIVNLKFKFMGFGLELLKSTGAQAAGSIVGEGLGLLTQGIKNKQQLKQAGRLQELEIKGSKELTDYNMSKQLQMWKDTSYGAQVEQMNKAGINPALMYGMGGGGGQTTGNASGSVSGQGAGTAQKSSGSEGMGLLVGQMGLMKAQKENIEADTANKIADSEGKGLANAFTAWMQSTDLEGNDVGFDMGKSTRGLLEREEVKNKQADVKKTDAETRFKLDENERARLMNSAVLKEIGAKISLMAKQGLQADAITENLKKDGLIKQAEIEWNALDMNSGNFGKFMTNMIKMAVKPK